MNTNPQLTEQRPQSASNSATRFPSLISFKRQRSDVCHQAKLNQSRFHFFSSINRVHRLRVKSILFFQDNYPTRIATIGHHWIHTTEL